MYTDYKISLVTNEARNRLGLRSTYRQSIDITKEGTVWHAMHILK